MPARDGRPIFILAGGQRTGSTLLQRLLVSTREVMVWGEHGGLLVEHLSALARGMHEWLRVSDAPGQLARFRAKDEQWIPNINPGLSTFGEACRSFILTALAQPALDAGYARWGFKEVRYGAAEARFLQALFPDACFVMLLRDPRDCLRSIKAADWDKVAPLPDGPQPFLLRWARLSGELAEAATTMRNTMLVRYEDLVGRPEEMLPRIAGLCGLSQAALAASPALGRVERGPSHAHTDLSDEDLAALGHPEVKAVAMAVGYGADSHGSAERAAGRAPHGAS